MNSSLCKNPSFFTVAQLRLLSNRLYKSHSVKITARSQVFGQKTQIHDWGAPLQHRTWVPHAPSPNLQTTPRTLPEFHKADKPTYHALGSQKDWLENVVLASDTQELQQSEECSPWADGTDEPRDTQKGRQL